jgi:hypothetical protein
MSVHPALLEWANSFLFDPIAGSYTPMCFRTMQRCSMQVPMAAGTDHDETRTMAPFDTVTVMSASRPLSTELGPA